jgi:hypothetical protein
MILFCCGTLGWAQDPAADKAPAEKPRSERLQIVREDRPWLQKVIDVKYADVNALAKVIGNLTQGDADPRINRALAQPDLHAIAIGTYDPTFLQFAEEVIKRYDVPGRAPSASRSHNIELVTYLLIASHKGAAGNALPADLDGVAKQLRGVFGYTDIKLLDGALTRSLEGHKSQTNGSINGIVEGGTMPADYQIFFEFSHVEQGEKRNSIVLHDFRFTSRVPYEYAPGKWNNAQVDFTTDLDIPEGQKVVVGKSNIGIDDKALVLVLTAHLVD